MSEGDEAKTPTSDRYDKAKACVTKATDQFPGVATIDAREVLKLQRGGKNVVLVDVRTDAEIGVSILRGAITREEFESTTLGAAAKTSEKLVERSAVEGGGGGGGGGGGEELIVPYCTVGYRSGQYAKKLQDLGYPSVRNSEGVVLWTHDVGSGLVMRTAATARSEDGVNREVKRVHVYGSPWDYAREDFESVKFSPTGWISSTTKSVFSKLFRR